jgi:CheY-like chemotaxis protein
MFNPDHVDGLEEQYFASRSLYFHHLYSFKTTNNIPMKKKTILLVEDNPDEEELTRLALEQSPFKPYLVVAHDGLEALTYLFDKGITPDLVLLDINLPKMNGLQVLKRLRSDLRTKFLPVVMMTTSAEPQDMLNSYSYGCNSYIRKPVDFNQFQSLVQQLGLYWLQCNVSPPLNVPVSTPAL